MGQEWGRGKVAVVEVERPTPVDRVAETGVRVAAVVGRGQVQADGEGKPFGMWMVVVAVDLMAGITVAGVAGLGWLGSKTLETWGLDLGQSRGGVLARVLADTGTAEDGSAVVEDTIEMLSSDDDVVETKGPKTGKADI